MTKTNIILVFMSNQPNNAKSDSMPINGNQSADKHNAGNLTKEQAIEQIKARELAIENDDFEASEKCRQFLFPKDGRITSGIYKFWFRHSTDKDLWVHSIDLESLGHNNSIPATELLKLLEGEKEWMPEVGEPVQVSNDNDKWFGLKITYFGKGTPEYPFLVKMEDGRVDSWKFCRPIQKQKITVSELLNKVGLDPKEWEVIND